MKNKREKISNSTIEHSSRGTFTAGGKNNKPKLLSGGHGEENIQTLKNMAGIIILLQSTLMVLD